MSIQTSSNTFSVFLTVQKDNFLLTLVPRPARHTPTNLYLPVMLFYLAKLNVVNITSSTLVEEVRSTYEIKDRRCLDNFSY